MRSWWKSLGVLAGGLVSLGGLLPSAHGQYPPPGGGMMMPPPGMPPGMMGGNGMPPGAFNGNPNLVGQPADFPNPAVPSGEPTSPFSLKDEGIPGAFTDQIDPRPRLPQPYTVIVKGEYIGWWISKGPSRVDLVTTNTNPTVESGALGEPNTVILVPANNNAIDYGRLYGFRATAGLAIGYLPPIEVSGFAINRNFKVFEEISDGSGRLLARPVQLANINNGPNAGVEAADVVTIPGVLNGSLSIVSRLSLWGTDVNALFNCVETRNLRIDLMLGYRHADLYESLEITNASGGITGNVIFNGAPQPLGFSTVTSDIFRTRNAFDGGQFGLRAALNFDRLSLSADAKLALGPTQHFLTIDGNTDLLQNIAGRGINSSPGGLLALPSNSGTTTRNQFSVVSEGNVTLGYQLARSVRVFGGYNILYWSSVSRPGDHLNAVIDARGVPGAALFAPGTGTLPTPPPIALRDFWAHGFTFGVEIGF